MEETSYNDFDWVVLLKYPTPSSTVKILSLALVGFTWQWRRLSCHYPNEGITSSFAHHDL